MDYFVATAAAIVLTGIVVSLHYEALNLLDRLTSALGNHRTTLLAIMFGLLAAHVIEIWVFAVGYLVVVQVFGIGTFTPNDLGLFDYSYYSAMVYTTVGFGDIVPQEAIRMITSAEALTGLALITWSASYTFLRMRKLWRD
jgi:hypothetical protein